VKASSAFILVSFLTASGACRMEPSETTISVFARARASDAQTVVIRFSEPIDVDRSRLDQLAISTAQTVAAQDLGITSYEIIDNELMIKTVTHRGGAVYSVRLEGIEFIAIMDSDAPSQVNFAGFGLGRVQVQLDTRGFVLDSDLELLATVEPDTGRYRDTLQTIVFTQDAIANVFTATLSVQIDPTRVYAVRAQTQDQKPASELLSFTVTSTRSQTLTLNCSLEQTPEFPAPIDRIVGDNMAPVRIIVDDRLARELQAPKLRLSINAMGEFDLASETLVRLRKIPGYDRVYDTTVNIVLDEARRLDGATESTFPYIAYLVERDEDFPARGLEFTMTTERPQTHVILVGNPALVPVTFRVDAGQAWLEPDGQLKGVYPRESLFLTGEFPAAEDAFGRIAADAFTGGERTTLRMKRRTDAHDVFEKTVFMQPDRPYGWKVVRCPAEEGCAAINRRVTSSGRAFPTVMKNLVSQNQDAASNPAVVVIDPAQPGAYESAVVSLSGDETPSHSVIFKQEVPDMVVHVKREPIITPIHVIGTWRDVNIPTKPVELIEQGGVIDLNPFDYDSGWIGVAPLVRTIQLPIDPGPERPTPGQPGFAPTDGQVDESARQWTSSETGRLPLWLSWNETRLYVATDPALPGEDKFIIVATSTPSMNRNMPWAKAGQMATGTYGLFLAMEGDGDFQGWFRTHSSSANDIIIEDAAAQASAGSVLEGTIDLALSGQPNELKSIWVAVIAAETSDGGALQPSTQNPSGNSDFTLDQAEFIRIQLLQIRAYP
jgi:hypothetical protein